MAVTVELLDVSVSKRANVNGVTCVVIVVIDAVYGVPMARAVPVPFTIVAGWPSMVPVGAIDNVLFKVNETVTVFPDLAKLVLALFEAIETALSMMVSPAKVTMAPPTLAMFPEPEV